MSFQQAGCHRLPRTVTARFSGVGARRFFRFFTPGATHQRRIRIVDSCGDVFSDPGATPGASTIFFRGAFAPRTPLHALSLAASPARSDRVARSLRSLAVFAPAVAPGSQIRPASQVQLPAPPPISFEGLSPLELPYSVTRSRWGARAVPLARSLRSLASPHAMRDLEGREARCGPLRSRRLLSLFRRLHEMLPMKTGVARACTVASPGANRTCGARWAAPALTFGRLAERRIRTWIIFRVSGVPVSSQSTLSPRGGPGLFSAAASRLVNGRHRIRLPVGTLTGPHHSDRATQSCRLSTSTSFHSSPIISPHRRRRELLHRPRGRKAG